MEVGEEQHKNLKGHTQTSKKTVAVKKESSNSKREMEPNEVNQLKNKWSLPNKKVKVKTG